MEVIPEGKAGFFDGFVGLGSAIGAFLGPFLVFSLTYTLMFIIAAVLFFLAYLTLKIIR
jgi:predicted MFS family arabinose efflux permease